MDVLATAYYEERFTNEFLKARGESFQALFTKVMSLAHPGDFMPCRPWGRIGDRKNDGYLASERTLFQVYGPNEISQSETIRKIKEDFTEALSFWKEHFDTWVFMHNSINGLPPDVLKHLLDLGAMHSSLTITQWSLEELKLRFRRIPADALPSWLGVAPSSEGKMTMGFDELRLVLETVAQAASAATDSAAPVSAGKIKANALSPPVTTLLRAGMEKARLVGEFFDMWHDPQYGDHVAGTFRVRYIALREQRPPLSGDEIYDALLEWASGTSIRTSAQRVAVLAVLAFLFEQCDIFEPARP